MLRCIGCGWLAIVALWAALPAAAQAHHVWFVNAAASCSASTGSLLRPFCTIQQAVERAGEDDEVLVLPGVYAGPIVIGVAGLRLSGVADPVDPATRPGQRSVVRQTLGEGETLIEIAADDVEVSNLVVARDDAPCDDEAGVPCQTGNGISADLGTRGQLLTHNRLTGTFFTGILARDGLVAGNRISGPGVLGIFASGSDDAIASVSVLDNVVENQILAGLYFVAAVFNPAGAADEGPGRLRVLARRNVLRQNMHGILLFLRNPSAFDGAFTSNYDQGAELNAIVNNNLVAWTPTADYFTRPALILNAEGNVPATGHAFFFNNSYVNGDLFIDLFGSPGTDFVVLDAHHELHGASLGFGEGNRLRYNGRWFSGADCADPDQACQLP